MELRENRKMMEWSQNKEMICDVKIIERGKTGEDIRREGGEMVEIKTRRRKEVE